MRMGRGVYCSHRDLATEDEGNASPRGVGRVVGDVASRGGVVFGSAKRDAEGYFDDASVVVGRSE